MRQLKMKLCASSISFKEQWQQMKVTIESNNPSTLITSLYIFTMYIRYVDTMSLIEFNILFIYFSVLDI